GCGGCGCGADDAGRGPGAAAAGDLDVREIPRAVRHEQVFAAVDALEPRESLVLAVDHDPVPLREQIEQREPGQIVWEYLAEGPELWRVQLSRVPGHCC
uniref:DUF2249 domain-containing protein n=1 Tax=Actinotalea sp. C106 TaxID=2908644 RepID=UPI002028237B